MPLADRDREGAGTASPLVQRVAFEIGEGLSLMWSSPLREQVGWIADLVGTVCPELFIRNQGHGVRGRIVARSPEANRRGCVIQRLNQPDPR